jgi:hypothetical protein
MHGWLDDRVRKNALTVRLSYQKSIFGRSLLNDKLENVIIIREWVEISVPMTFIQ